MYVCLACFSVFLIKKEQHLIRQTAFCQHLNNQILFDYISENCRKRTTVAYGQVLNLNLAHARIYVISIRKAFANRMGKSNISISAQTNVVTKSQLARACDLRVITTFFDCMRASASSGKLATKPDWTSGLLSGLLAHHQYAASIRTIQRELSRAYRNF